MTVIVDSREQTPYTFEGYSSITRVLDVGDYSIVGFESNGCIVERKSLSDFVSSITTLREVFMERLKKMSCFERAWVIIESSLARIERGNYLFSKTHPQSVIGSIAKIESKYKVSVILSDTHRLGNLMCKKILEQYYEKKREGLI